MCYKCYKNVKNYDYFTNTIVKVFFDKEFSAIF